MKTAISSLLFVAALVLGVAAHTPVIAQQGCGCAPTVKRITSPPGQAGRVEATFPGRLYPTFVRVGGTQDQMPMRPNGAWNSRDRYPSTPTTLQMLSTKRHVIRECRYDANGTLIPIVPPNCEPEWWEFSNETGVGTVTINWVLSGQAGVQRFDVERRTNGTGDFTVVGRDIALRATADSDGLFRYSYTQTGVASGTYEYRVVAVCVSGTRIVAPIAETVSL